MGSSPKFPARLWLPTRPKTRRPREVDTPMRKVLFGLGLSSLLGLSSGAFPMTGAACCQPVAGYTLARVEGTEGPVGPGGTVLLELRRVFDADQAVALPLTSISVRRGRRSRERIAVRQLAPNLFAFEMPRAEGTYTISLASLEVDVDASAASPPAVTSAPVLASPPLRTARVVRTAATTLDLAGATTPGALGVVLAWEGGAWFVPNGDRFIGPGRCSPDVAGYEAIATGDLVTARLVDGGGRFGAEVSFTAAIASAR